MIEQERGSFCNFGNFLFIPGLCRSGNHHVRFFQFHILLEHQHNTVDVLNVLVNGTAFGMDTTAIQIADNIIGCTGVVFIGVFQKVLQHKVRLQLLIFLFAVLGNDPTL